jgi:F0F1-type ATP synthase membrane subunit b/b'
MNISWFEIIAQIINFFVILFILQKLLYKPVLKAMVKRQEKIQKSQIEADEKMKEANELMRKYNKKIEDIQKEKHVILDEAIKEAHEKKESLLVDYKKEAENKRKIYLEEVEDEKEDFTNNLRQNIGNSAIKIASYILGTISSKELEKEIFDTFILNLKDLKSNIPNIEVFKEETVDLHSFRDLSQDEKKMIEGVLKDQIKVLKVINYETDPSLILGYELNFETYMIHTNVKNYLNIIEKDIIKNLDIN